MGEKVADMAETIASIDAEYKQLTKDIDELRHVRDGLSRRLAHKKKQYSSLRDASRALKRYVAAANEDNQ